MDDQLDEDLKNRIRKVFENYDDPAADEGWLKLREKFPEEKANRRAFAWLWWSVAALLLLLLGFGIWKYTAIDNAEKLSVNKTHGRPTHENLISEKKTPPNINKTGPVIVKNRAKAPAENTATNRLANKSAVTSPVHSSILQYARAGNTYSGANSKTVKTDTANTKKYTAKIADTVKHAPDQSSVNQLATNQPNNQASKPEEAKPVSKPKSIAEMFARDNAPQAKTEGVSPKVRFGIYAATYFNYAKGSGDQGNVGAGITAEIKISHNLKLVSGVTVAQNSLSFNNSVPTSTAQTNVFSSAIGVPGAAAASAAVTPSAYSLNATITEAASPAFKNYDASLVGIDIPLNLKYELNPDKNNIYFMAGFSSGTFINETYTYEYNYPALTSQSLQQTQDATSNKSFNSFYFAKILNVAFGVGYPLGKNQIIIEPFLKYPLEGLGVQDIRFGAGGINLKFNFGTSGK